MRGYAVIILVFAIGTVLVASVKDRNYPHFVKQRARPRELRGFKPKSMSTAIDFGKRQSPSGDEAEADNHERFLSMHPQYFPRGIPVEWLLKQIKADPVLGIRLRQLLTDEHGDLISTMDYLDP